MSSPVLNPLLQAALGSLDVNLEDELIRYRRLNRGSKSPESKSNFRREHTLVAPPSGTEKLDLPSFDSASTATEIDATTQLQENASEEGIASDLVHQPTESEAKQNLAEPTKNQQPPEDYLESSEQLLRSLEEKKSETQKPEPKKTSPWKQVLFSPLGIASVAVFVVASTLLGAALLESETANKLGLGDLFASGDGDVETEPTNETIAGGEQRASSPTGPNLANNQEFTKELDLDTLSTVESGATPDTDAAAVKTPDVAISPSPVPNTAPQSSSSDLTEALIPRSIDSQASQNPETTVSPDAAEPQPITPEDIEAETAPSKNEPYHFVIVDYTGPDSLLKARTVVKDAYLREFGQNVKIQMSASNTKADAQRLVEELKQKGISASIFNNQ